MSKITSKMLAKNYFADIMGINLEYTLEAYDWQGFYPMTDNGITVTGFWDKRKGVPTQRYMNLMNAVFMCVKIRSADPPAIAWRNIDKDPIAL